MIVSCEIVEKHVEWLLDNGEKVKITDYSAESVVNDESMVLIMVRKDKDDNVIVFDEYGTKLYVLENSDSFYIEYIQKHPRFGLVVVASEKIDNKWKDGQYCYMKNAGFICQTNSR